MSNKLFLIWVLICIGTSNCISLDNICNVFEHNGMIVNSFHFIINSNTVENSPYYFEQENIGYDDLIQNKTALQIINSSKKVYYNAMRKIYSEKFINDLNNLKEISSISKTINNIISKFLHIKRYISDKDKREQFGSRTHKEFSRGLFFTHMIEDYSNHKFICLAKHEDLPFLRELTKRLAIEEKENYAFKNETAEEIHAEREIVLFSLFLKHNYFRPNSMFITIIYIPFYNPNYRKTKDCTPNARLPKFYHH